MADLRINFAGIKSPNPFWLASPAHKLRAQIHKAFEAGWGGAVWKTIALLCSMCRTAMAPGITPPAHVGHQ